MSILLSQWSESFKSSNIFGLFARLTQNSESNLKLTHAFLEFFFCPIHPTSSWYSRKCHQFFFFFFFSKIIFLLSHPHHLQEITRLPLWSIPQPPWTTNLKLLMHLKSIYTLFLTCYELKTTSLSLCLHIHPKNSSFWFKFFYGL